jgi:DNA-binding CsgD family transcriptional regulator
VLVGRRAECEALDRILSDALAGRSRVLVLRGEAGAGKTALLDYVSSRVGGWRVARAAGVESEMELAYSGVHQLAAPMLDLLDRLPPPQRDSLAKVFGLSPGPAPDPFLVGLALLTLVAEVSDRQPLACLVDDAHWLDQASAKILGFVARRLVAERIVIVCVSRIGPGDDVLAGQPEIHVRGLNDGDARALLLESVRGPLDAAVRDQIVAESHGNPLALLELPRTWNASTLAGGFGLPDSRPVASRIEQSYARRLLALPDATRLLVLAAAAEPLGDPLLLDVAAEALALDLADADPAVDAGLLTLGPRVEFAHPLVRSAAYRTATLDDRHRVHRALADATDAEADPDRRAWHRARAAPGPDEEVAAELEASADRAQSRGGLAAAAAFLGRATALTAEPSRRVARALSAAQIAYEAGSLEDAMGLLATGEAGPLDDLQRCRVLLLRAQIAFASRQSIDARPMLLEAAREAEAADVSLARAIYLEAMHAALHAGRLDHRAAREVSEAVLACPPPPAPGRPRDLLLDGLAIRFTQGYAAGATVLKEALAAFRRDATLPAADAHWFFLGCRVASDLWDDETRDVLSRRQLARARAAGALAAVPVALDANCVGRAIAGELDAAEAMVGEMRVVSEATGIAAHSSGALFVAALRGREAEACDLIERAAAEAAARGEGLGLAGTEHAAAILYNGLGRYGEALSAARACGEHDAEIGPPTWALAELVEAAVRCRDVRAAEAAIERLLETTQASGTEWALGVAARSRALLANGAAAEELYLEAVERLSGTRLRPDLARAHLLYGEWLRRDGRRVDAREQLHRAYDMLADIGMEAFAERAHRELLATGERARKRRDESRGELTPQEEQIARLARDGLSNPEIGARLFLSGRTVEWHLRKVFTKLGISSRRQLGAALPEEKGVLTHV